jgi:hypothetical protein
MNTIPSRIHETVLADISYYAKPTLVLTCFNTFVSSCQAMCKKPETKNALRLVPRERSIV